MGERVVPLSAAAAAAATVSNASPGITLVTSTSAAPNPPPSHFPVQRNKPHGPSSLDSILVFFSLYQNN